MFFRYNLLTILWATVIFLLILMPGRQMPDIGELFSFDKLAHLGVFAVLSFLMIIGFKKQQKYQYLRKNAVLISMLVSMLYASVLELGQSAVPGRYANFYDMMFNSVGVLAGYLGYFLVYKFSFR